MKGKATVIGLSRKTKEMTSSTGVGVNERECFTFIIAMSSYTNKCESKAGLQGEVWMFVDYGRLVLVICEIDGKMVPVQKLS